MTSAFSRIVLLGALASFASIVYASVGPATTAPASAKSVASPPAQVTKPSTREEEGPPAIEPRGLTINQSSSSAPSKDGDEKSSSVLLVSALAWPLAILLCLLMFRKQLIALIGRLANFKYGEFSIEFQAEKSNAAMRRISTKKVVTSKDIEAVFEAVKHNDWATLVMARMLMRRGLMALVDVPANEDPSLQKMLPKAEVKIGKELKDKLEQLRTVTFYAEWWRGGVPTGEQWQWAVENAKPLIEQLFSKLPIH